MTEQQAGRPDPATRWFLRADERGNPGTTIDGRHSGLAWTGGNREDVAQLVQNQLNQVGFDVKLETMDIGSLNAGASFGQIEGVLSIVNPLLSFDQWKKVKELWRTAREGWAPGN